MLGFMEIGFGIFLYAQWLSFDMNSVKGVLQNKGVYLDYAAATPMRSEVVQSMIPYFSDHFGNAGSIHFEGENARAGLDLARVRVRSLLGCEEEGHIIFTASGTESINLALRGVVVESYFREGKKKVHVVSSSIEHKAVLETLLDLQKMGFCDVTLVGVDSHGLVRVKDIESALRKNTVLVTLHYVHNELGVVQSIASIGKLLRRQGVLFHVDACQAFCYYSCNVDELGCDLLTLNSSKVGGPKGVGLLYVRDGVILRPIVTGGPQEFGLRAGTENIAGIVGFAHALGISNTKRALETVRVMALRDHLWHLIKSNVENVKCNSDLKRGSPHILSVSIKGVEGEHVVRYLSEKGICVSTGSACTSREVQVSSSVLAIGRGMDYAAGTIRFSLGWETRKSDLNSTVRELVEVVSFLRKV